MRADLLERRDEQAALRAATAAAQDGRGSVVLVSGEAGIGKSSLVDAFRGDLDRGVRVLAGACDDLLAPRALGPLRDAARGTGGPLERALVDGPEAVFAAIVAQLSTGPTVLVVEDVHWADDATLDVLHHLARRIAALPAVLVLTFREEAVPTGHPVQDLLGRLAGTPSVRLRLAPLSPAAVSDLAAGSGRDGLSLYGATGGNPFYVTEALAAPRDEMPASVADAVLARMRRLAPDCVAALQQLSVVPTSVDFPLAEALLGSRLEALAEAEERGIVEVRPAGLAFRHDLARRAVEAALPTLRRRILNLAVVGALRESALRRSRDPDVERLVHHAVQAGDGDTVVEFALQAGRAAADAGSHRQALAHLEAAVAHLDLLSPAEQGRLLDDYSWELHIAHRFTEAVTSGRTALRLFEQVGDPVAVGVALGRLARYVFLTGDSDEAERMTARAVEVLRDEGPGPAAAAATTFHGSMLTLTGQLVDAVPVLRDALALAQAVDRPDLVSLCLNYLGLSRAGLGEPEAGEADLRRGLVIAVTHGSHEPAARAYVNLGDMLNAYGDWPAFAENLERGTAFVEEHNLNQFAHVMELQRHQLQLHSGDWDTAEHGLRALIDRAEPGVFDAAGLATYGRLLARRDCAEAGGLLKRAWDQARQQRLPLAELHAGRAVVEWAWLTADPDRAREVADVLLPRMQSAGWANPRGELSRYLARAGWPVEPFDGCPAGWAAGLRGDWRAAAAHWERAGDPYERALELAGSGAVEPTLEALRALDDLDAVAAARIVRYRLRQLGVNPPPRPRTGPARPHPGGLTDRQLDVLDLLADGATNAEIAARLVLSVRTVDHHVAAILARLGVRSRREAVAAARSVEPGATA